MMMAVSLPMFYKLIHSLHVLKIEQRTLNQIIFPIFFPNCNQFKLPKLVFISELKPDLTIVFNIFFLQFPWLFGIEYVNLIFNRNVDEYFHCL